MPVINFSYSDLCELVGREVPRDLLREKLPLIGADLKSVPEDGDELSFEFFPDRPDLFSVEGISRAVRAFFAYEPGLRTYNVDDSDVDLVVDPSVNEVRPYIWSALVEGNEITDPLIRSMMDLQEKLHLTHGRNRKKVAIGIHDFRTVKPPFTYKAVLPDELSFIPLQGSRRMTPAEILKEHEKGMAYAFVLDGKKRYPIIVDKEGEVLSFPPIINGITTAITEETTDIFVDCTGTDLNAVKGAVNILTTALAERGGRIRSVRITQDGKGSLAPDLNPQKMSLDPVYANKWIGTGLSADEMAGCLRRMGYGAVPGKTGLEVLVPRYRTDILHPVDLAEDVAIGYGFEKFGASLPIRATFGVEDPVLEFGSSVKTIMVGLGYFEVVTLSLSNPKDQFSSMNLPEDKNATRVRNPVSIDHTLVRTSLLPSLMTVLRRNKHRELPQRIFEVGDVVVNGKNRVLLSGVAIHAKASFTEIKSLAQSVVSGLGLDYEIVQHSHPSFIGGRCASVEIKGEPVGVMGEISPFVIESFELRYPMVAFELDLDKLRAVRNDSPRSD
ncbi:MAG: phenylalanine--tRNA ligase subunit beta [Euryarchaeota archaeon RBG_19FT_COMBO_56_21]|nr:MAG: phenylalanine--tRNA ligase subunit beta [Euryarchaeota archaeon RBG_19FT_COMBO_56_21]